MTHDPWKSKLDELILRHEEGMNYFLFFPSRNSYATRASTMFGHSIVYVDNFYYWDYFSMTEVITFFQRFFIPDVQILTYEEAKVIETIRC